MAQRASDLFEDATANFNIHDTPFHLALIRKLRRGRRGFLESFSYKYFGLKQLLVLQETRESLLEPTELPAPSLAYRVYNSVQSGANQYNRRAVTASKSSAALMGYHASFPP